LFDNQKEDAHYPKNTIDNFTSKNHSKNGMSQTVIHRAFCAWYRICKAEKEMPAIFVTIKKNLIIYLQ
jgi:hypothetical protein